MDCPQGTIGLLYTSDEWQVLDQLALLTGNCDFRTFLYRKVVKLGKWADSMEDGPEQSRIQKKFMVPEGTSCQLMILSRHFNIPIATLVARFIISPALKEHYEKKGSLIIS